MCICIYLCVFELECVRYCKSVSLFASLFVCLYFNIELCVFVYTISTLPKYETSVCVCLCCVSDLKFVCVYVCLLLCLYVHICALWCLCIRFPHFRSMKLMCMYLYYTYDCVCL